MDLDLPLPKKCVFSYILVSTYESMILIRPLLKRVSDLLLGQAHLLYNTVTAPCLQSPK